MEPAPANQDRAKLIDQLVEEYGSFERFQQMVAAQAGGQDAVNALSNALDQVRAKFTLDAWKSIMDHLYDFKVWQPLADDPQAFNAELNKTIAKLRRWMKVFYGIKSQRPSKNAERDKKIYGLRQQGKSFGEIGIDMKISDKAAERACKRHEEKQKVGLRDTLKFFLELTDQAAQNQPPPSKPESSSTPT